MFDQSYRVSYGYLMLRPFILQAIKTMNCFHILFKRGIVSIRKWCYMYKRIYLLTRNPLINTYHTLVIHSKSINVTGVTFIIRHQFYVEPVSAGSDQDTNI